MSTFKEYLTEDYMSRQEAEKLLGLGVNYDSEEVEKSFRRAARVAHPDKGGSKELMQNLYTARKILKGKSSSDKVDWDAIHEKYISLANQIADEISDKFQPTAFTQYFEKYFNQPFDYSVDVVGKNHTGYGSPSYAGIKAKFFNIDKSILFDFSVEAYLANVKVNNMLGGGNPDISYPVMVVAYGYANRKKQKMARSDWGHDNNHAILTDPSLTFKPAKMKKIAGGGSEPQKMKRADFALAIKNELGGIRWNDDSYRIELADGNSILMTRIVFKRVGSWDVKVGNTPSKYRFVTVSRTGMFPEDTKTIDTLLKAKAKDIDGAVEFLKRKYEEIVNSL